MIHENIPDDVKRCGVNLSGGVDSAILLYILCEEIVDNNLDLELTAITGVDVQMPFNEHAAAEILEIIEKKFPSIVFNEHCIFTYNLPRPSNNALVDGTGEARNAAKSKFHFIKEQELYKAGIIDIVIRGITKNPPIDDITDPELLEKMEANRQPGELIMLCKAGHVPEGFDGNLYYYTPFHDMHKKDLAALYYEKNLMHDIFPLTESCISYGDQGTNYYTQPCRTCWFCREKYWAFGLYDGESPEI